MKRFLAIFLILLMPFVSKAQGQQSNGSSCP